MRDTLYTSFYAENFTPEVRPQRLPQVSLDSLPFNPYTGERFIMKTGAVEVGRVWQSTILVQDPTPFGREKVKKDTLRFGSLFEAHRDATGAIDWWMGQLALIWDGTWLTWSAHDAPGTIVRREISSPSMVKEVLKALQKQVAPGTSVIHAGWACPATVVPSALLNSSWEREVVTKLHETLHGPVQSSAEVQLHALDLLDDHPCLAVEGELNWEQSLLEVFPQARRVPVILALVHDALQLNRKDGHKGWTFRVDVRPKELSWWLCLENTSNGCTT